MNAQIALAKHRLFADGGLDAQNVKLFPGTSRDVTAEQLAEQFNKAISQMESGDFDNIDEIDD